MNDLSEQTLEEVKAELERRIASPLIERDGHLVLSILDYTPFLLNAVANSWHRIASQRCREKFGVGITEWRVLATLEIEPGITANGICDLVKLDKAAVSRSVKGLESDGLIRASADSQTSRNKAWYLTDNGRATYENILVTALSHEQRLVDGIPLADLEICLRSLRKMLDNSKSWGK